MAAMSEMNLVIEELRTAAKALISAADSLAQMYSAPKETETGLLQERKPLTLEEVFIGEMEAVGYDSKNILG